MPLSVLECETDFRPGREVLPMRQARPVEVFNGIHANPVKQMIAMFLAESLSMLLRESVPDEGVYTFIHSSVKWLDSIPAECSANFHVCFLLNLGRLLGIEPDVFNCIHLQARICNGYARRDMAVVDAVARRMACLG